MGAALGARLISRLADLRAAGSLGEVIDMLSVTVDDRHAKATVALDEHGALLHLKANHQECPRLGNGAVDWHHVMRVQLLSIEVSA